MMAKSAATIAGSLSVWSSAVFIPRANAERLLEMIGDTPETYVGRRPEHQRQGDGS